jgi:hypothetical protein
MLRKISRFFLFLIVCLFLSLTALFLSASMSRAAALPPGLLQPSPSLPPGVFFPVTPPPPGILPPVPSPFPVALVPAPSPSPVSTLPLPLPLPGGIVLPQLLPIFQEPIFGAVVGDTTRVSVASDGTQADGGSFHSDISGDYSTITFDSSATNLIIGDTNTFSDVFTHNRLTGITSRVSVSSGGTEGNNPSDYPAISTDAAWITFRSTASNLVSNDTNGKMDVFLRDVALSQTTRVSVASDGTEANGDSSFSDISADASTVTFHSFASNLVLNDTNNTWDVFVHDLASGSTTRVSVSSSGTEANGLSQYPSLSSNGTYVAFHSFAEPNHACLLIFIRYPRRWEFPLRFHFRRWALCCVSVGCPQSCHRRYEQYDGHFRT